MIAAGREQLGLDGGKLRAPEKEARIFLGAKLLRASHVHGRPDGGIGHYCQGCGIVHVFSIDKPDARGRRWQWDGNAAAPTFFPDMDVWPPRPASPPNYFSASRCRYTLIAGVIEFFDDCTHRLAGRRVPLPDLPGHLRE